MAETSTVAEDLLEVIRKECLGMNCGGIKRLGAVFRHLDLDYSKRITFEELRDGLHKFGIHMSQEYLRILFNAFDKDSSGGIDFCEFMNELRPPLSPSRLEVTDEAFHSLDANGNGYIEIEDLKGMYWFLTISRPRFSRDYTVNWCKCIDRNSQHRRFCCYCTKLPSQRMNESFPLSYIHALCELDLYKRHASTQNAFKWRNINTHTWQLVLQEKYNYLLWFIAYLSITKSKWVLIVWLMLCKDHLRTWQSRMKSPLKFRTLTWKDQSIFSNKCVS